MASGIAQACRARIREFEKSQRIQFVFPVIVTNAPLIQCSLADDGKLQLQEVEQGELLFLRNDLGSCIRVVTANNLSAFALEAKHVGDKLQKEFKADGEQILSKAKPRVRLPETLDSD